jgi:hypothetical protein
MIGGTVLEVCDVPNRPDVLYVNVMDRQSGLATRQECAILVEKNSNSLRIEIGDAIWWQSGYAMWTPQSNRELEDGTLEEQGQAWGIRVPKVGPSGVRHPLDVAKSDSKSDSCDG